MMIKHISNAASNLKRRTNFPEALTACVVWLALLSSPVHAQTETSRTIQKEDTMTRLQATQRSSEQAADKDAIRPFHVSIPDEALGDLRRRILATQWPDKETVGDQSQGVPLATMRELEILDNITLYWLTNTAVSASRLYWEYKGGFFNPKGVKIPVAVTVFPGEQYQAPRSWTERAYPKLIYYNKVDKGGHFAAWEQPMILAAELRAAFKSMR
jgi:hypothetical protein